MCLLPGIYSLIIPLGTSSWTWQSLSSLGEEHDMQDPPSRPSFCFVTQFPGLTLQTTRKIEKVIRLFKKQKKVRKEMQQHWLKNLWKKCNMFADATTSCGTLLPKIRQQMTCANCIQETCGVIFSPHTHWHRWSALHDYHLVEILKNAVGTQ